MTVNTDWSPDEPLGTETFEQSDEALAEGSRLDPGYLERVEDDPSLDPRQQVDVRELAEIGAGFDDPETLVTLEGGMDDPDGLDQPPAGDNRPREGDGWELDASQTEEGAPL